MKKILYTLIFYSMIQCAVASSLCGLPHPALTCSTVNTPVVISSDTGLDANDMAIINGCTRLGGTPVIQVQSGVTLDLCAHTVDCNVNNPNGANTVDGIQLNGNGSNLLDGTVKGCRRGIVSNTGNNLHEINRITASNNIIGFSINATTDYLRNNIANNNIKIGFENTGRANRYYANIANGNGVGFFNTGRITTYGINLPSPLLGNISTASISHGFLDNGIMNTKLFKNLANASGGNGFQASSINTNAQYKFNIATANNNDGIAIYPVSNGRFTSNITTDNNAAGIHNYSSNSNSFLSNFSSGNNNMILPTPFDDLIDSVSATWIISPSNICGFSTPTTICP